MRKAIAVHACTECGHESTKWHGRCPGCGSWNTMFEEVRTTEPTSSGRPRAATEAAALGGGETEIPLARRSTGLAELDRVLGGGVVPGSAVLLGGDPGIGKSTLLLQALAGLGEKPATGAPDRRGTGGVLPSGPALYISAEESRDQVRMRAARLGLPFADGTFVLAETSVEAAVAEAERLRARVVVADSVQTLWSDRIPSAPGSVGQVREVASRLLALAKTGGAVVFLVGHVTKDGAIAGPRTLEHMVDTVLYFEGDRGRSHRIVRATKNRFGPTGEMGVFEMGEHGLVGVENASGKMLAERAVDVPGSCVLASVEGTRALLVEVQALAAESSTAMPRRTANGFDPNRLALLLAVLDRRAGIEIRGRDLFLNVVGGLELGEPAADLAVVCAAASAARDAAVDPTCVVFGEVGLAGEVRGVDRADLRLAEARRLGFARAVVPAANVDGGSGGEGLEVVGVRGVHEALEHVVGYSGARGRAAGRAGA